MADVSQVIQMQRLRSYAARRPVKNDKSITHLYQHQVTSSGIAEFLPNPKIKNTDARTINNYYYVPGKQAKSKVPTRNTWGSITIPPSTPPLIIGPQETLDFQNFVFTGSNIFTATFQLFPINVDTYYINFINIPPSISNIGFVSIESISAQQMSPSDTIRYINPDYIPVTDFSPGIAPNFISQLTHNVSPTNITTSTILILKTTNAVEEILIRIS